MGIYRSNLSLRTLLLLLVLLGAPLSARCDTLDDSARELAGKIAAALPAKENVSCEFRNASSLQPDEVGRIDEALKTALQCEGSPEQTNYTATTRILVTLSENLNNFVWAAQIRRGDTSQIVFTMSPRPRENAVASSALPITFRSEKFWEGPEEILDAVEVTPSNDAGMLYLLQPGGLMIRKRGANTEFKIEIPLVQVATRTPFGLVQVEATCQPPDSSSCVVVILNGYFCSIALEKRTVRECHKPGPFSPNDPMPPVILHDAIYPKGRSEPRTPLSNYCGAEIGFGTGAGDFTEPDFVEAYEWRGATYVPLSNELNFPGPVMALHIVGRVPTAIVRNLKTGNYEAYRLSISCAQ
jgi:hypothetical protein